MSVNSAAIGLARADLCRFLAACYYEPCREFSEERLFESLAGVAAMVDADAAAAARRVSSAFEAASLDDLLLDYTRLFIGPNDTLAQPYGAIWLSGEKVLMQESTIAVLDLYAAAGFELDEDFHDLPDHVAAELECLYLLTYRAVGARLEGDDSGTTALALRARLLDEHLGRWIPPFAAAVRDHARTGFYRELADLTSWFIAAERDRPL